MLLPQCITLRQLTQPGIAAGIGAILGSHNVVQQRQLHHTQIIQITHNASQQRLRECCQCTQICSAKEWMKED